MTSILPYLTANSYIRYPFKDGTSLKADSGEILPNNLIVDIQVVGNGNTCYLKKIIGNTYTFTLTQVDNEDLDIAVVVDSDEVNKTYTAVNNGVSIKVVIGKRTIYSSLVFQPSATEIVTSCVIPALPKVTKLNFKNYATPTLTSITPSSNVIVKNGNNVALFKNNDATLNLSVQSGAGLGLYNPCAGTAGGIIKKINGVQATANGNFNIFGGNCLEINGSNFDNKLVINHTCSPRCSEEQIQAFAYYLNRIKDGLQTVLSNAGNVKTKVDSLIAAYRGQINSNPFATTPYIDAAYAKTNTSKSNYYALIAAINNISKNPISYQVGITSINALPIPNTTFITTDNTNQPADDTTVFRNLLAGKTAYFESTVSGQNTTESTRGNASVWFYASDANYIYNSFKVFPFVAGSYVTVQSINRIGSSGVVSKWKVNLFPINSSKTSLLIEPIINTQVTKPKLYLNSELAATGNVTSSGYSNIDLVLNQQNYFEFEAASSNQILPTFKITFIVDNEQFIGEFGNVDAEAPNWQTSRVYFK